jgi:hypothetical protein
LLLQPIGERTLHRLQLAGKKMIGAGNQHQLFRFGGRCGDLLELRGGRKPVLIAA